MLALVVVVGVRHRACLDVGFVGWDTYPAIAHASALVGPWMGGVHPDATFYRPLTSAMLAVDRAVYGTSPTGYHVTDLLLLCAVAVAMAALARRVVPTGGPWLAVGAGAIVAMHPIQLEVVAVVVRRGDALALLATLVVGLLAGRRGRRQLVWIGVVAAAAVFAKEVGVLALAVAPVVAWLVRRPLLAPTVAAGVGVGAAFALRALVVGGLAGHDRGAAWWQTVRDTAPDYAAWVVDPLGWAPAWLPLVVLAVLACAVIALPAASRRVALGGVAWCAAALAIFGAAGRSQPWYAVHLVAPLALIGASCVAGAVTARREGRRLAGTAALLGAVVVVASAFAPVGIGWRQWQDGSADIDDYLGRLERTVRAHEPGATIVVPVPPLGVSRTKPALAGGALLTDYALPDALRLRGLDRPVVAHFAFLAAPVVRPGTTRLVVTPGAPWP